MEGSGKMGNWLLLISFFNGVTAMLHYDYEHFVEHFHKPYSLGPRPILKVFLGLLVYL